MPRCDGPAIDGRELCIPGRCHYAREAPAPLSPRMLHETYCTVSPSENTALRPFGSLFLCHKLELRRRFGLIVAIAAVFFLALAAAREAEAGSLAIELNKLEPQKDSCRAYVLVTNNSSTPYQALKLDLVLFQPDGVIGRRFALDLGPLPAQKRSVKMFDIDMPCDQVGSLLINDVLECNGERGSIPNCLADVTATSLTKAKLSK
jgi:hypothetical protein